MRVLDNPVYIGKITYGKSTTERVKGTRDEYHRVQVEDYMVTDGRHEAIIDGELWTAAQERRKETGVKWNKTHSLDHEHLLSGLVICPVCGKGFAGTVRRRKNKKTGEYKDDFYYRCQHRKKIDEEHFCDFKPSINQSEFNREVENVILDMAANEQWKEFVLRKMSERVDVSTLETEREQLKKHLRQVIGAKTKLTDMLDKLDVSDKHYDRKYQDMQDRLDNLYDKASELEDTIADIDSQINGAYEKQITAKQLYKILANFDRLYYRLTDLEKKEFLRGFIESVEIYPEKLDNGRMLKQINFNFPVYYDGEVGKEIRLLNENTVESIVLLSKLHTKQNIEVELEMSELDLTAAESKATYAEIKQYVLDKYGLKVSSLNIAQIKAKCGIIERENYNTAKNENVKQPNCTEEKENAIKNAFKYFQMI